jgi:hypothetical protein
VVAFGVVLVGPELGVVIQVPARELARGNAAGRRVEQGQGTLGPGMAALENRVVHHFVEHHREVEDREPLNERQRDPDQRVAVVDQPPGADRQQRELPDRDRQVPGR